MLTCIINWHKQTTVLVYLYLIFSVCFDKQGEWKPKMIDNPAYKGEWIHPEIDNPDYAPDPELYKYDDFGGIGFDLWQVCIHSLLQEFFLRLC